jgi:ribosomal protein S18 acetylase RimI-like enzyme
MLVADSNYRVVGFNQIIETNDSLIIDLIAILPEFQNHGLGRALVTRMRDLALKKDLIVGTQIANYQSINFYQSLGFRFHKAAYVFHKHGSDYERIKGDDV